MKYPATPHITLRTVAEKVQLILKNAFDIHLISKDEEVARCTGSGFLRDQYTTLLRQECDM